MYRHDAEGSDDMPVNLSPSSITLGYMADSRLGQAHIKSSLIGASVSVPISNGRLATGTWVSSNLVDHINKN